MIPPLLLLYVADRVHHAEENQRFAAKLRESGFDATVVAVQDRNHHTLAYNIGLSGDPATEQIMQFLARLCP